MPRSTWRGQQAVRIPSKAEETAAQVAASLSQTEASREAEPAGERYSRLWKKFQARSPEPPGTKCPPSCVQ